MKAIRNTFSIPFVFIVFCLLFLFALPMEVEAIPVFARNYQTSCATCHEAFPRLNSVGEAYRLNGFKFTDDELYIKEEPVELGDEAYKKIWPKAIWPSDIPGLPPISLFIASDYDVDIGGEKDARSSFIFPREAKLLSAGSLGEHISFFLEVGFNRGGGHGHGSEDDGETETDIGGWLQFEDLLSPIVPEDLFNIRVGTVGMQSMGLFTSRDHNRLTVNRYLYSSWTMPSLDLHAEEHGDENGHDEEAEEEEHHEEITPTAFEGNEFQIHAQPGVELNGFGKHWLYALGIVNGNGENVEDNNSEKDFYLQLAYKFGGLGFDGSGAMEKEGELPSAGAESWRDDSLILSFFGYRGTGLVEVETEEAAYRSNDDFWRLGGGFRWKIRDLAFFGGYMFGTNEDPYGVLSRKTVDSNTWFVGAEYFVLPWLIPSVRYETLSLDIPSGIPSLDRNQDRARFVLSNKALVRANISLTMEARFYVTDRQSTSKDNENQFVFSLASAF